jgi:hypothetical protein
MRTFVRPGGSIYIYIYIYIYITRACLPTPYVTILQSLWRSTSPNFKHILAPLCASHIQRLMYCDYNGLMQSNVAEVSFMLCRPKEEMPKNMWVDNPKETKIFWITVFPCLLCIFKDNFHMQYNINNTVYKHASFYREWTRRVKYCFKDPDHPNRCLFLDWCCSYYFPRESSIFNAWGTIQP